MKIFDLCVTVLVIWFPLENHLIEAISINMEESSGCGDFWEKKYKKILHGEKLGHQMVGNNAECVQICTDIADCIAVEVYTVTERADVGCIMYSDYLRTKWSDVSNLYFRMEHCGGKKCHLVEHRYTSFSTNRSLAMFDENEEQGCYNNCTLNPQCFVAMYTPKRKCLLYDALRQASGALQSVNYEGLTRHTWLKICEDENTEVYDPCQPTEHCRFTEQKNTTIYNKVLETKLYVTPGKQLIPLCKRGCLDNPACVGFYVYSNSFCQWFSANASEYEVTYSPGYDTWNLKCEEGGSNTPRTDEYCDFNQESNALIDEILEIETLTYADMCKRKCLETPGCVGFTEGVSTCTLFSEISVTKEELDNGDDESADDADDESADNDHFRKRSGRDRSGSKDSDSADSDDGDGGRHRGGSESSDSDDGDGGRHKSGSESADSADGDGGRHKSGSESADSGDGDGGRYRGGSESADSGDGGRHKSGSDSADSTDGDGGRYRGGSKSADSADSADGDGSRDCRCGDSANSADDERLKKLGKFPDIWYLECDPCSASLPVQ